ncbi:hypothetical protein NL676_035251 [Syzygium grande]|nr:hypothetical protein NL676_035251 [Syzygium grande]
MRDELAAPRRRFAAQPLTLLSLSRATLCSLPSPTPWPLFVAVAASCWLLTLDRPPTSSGMFFAVQNTLVSYQSPSVAE